MIEFSKAMNELQSEMMVVGKKSKAYNYNYADIAHVIEMLYPLMTKHGFSVVQLLDNLEGHAALATTVYHVSGDSVKGVCPLPDAGMAKQNDAQNMGSAITYLRRYALLAAFGISVADDDAASLTKVVDNLKAKTLSGPDKDEATKLLEGAKSVAQMKKIAASCKARATAEGWITELTDLYQIRVDEFKEAK